MRPRAKKMKTIHVNPSDLLDKEEESKSQQIIIQFRDQEETDVGFEISVDSNISKVELNKLLSEVRTPSEGEQENQVF
jgi:hypothetical protein